jgi:hypothetical protein
MGAFRLRPEVMRRVSCRRKFRHNSRGKAEAAMRALVKRCPEDDGKLNVYFCADCGSWHVGHKFGVRTQ